MLTVADCYYIGYVKKAHGLDGELEIVLDVDDPSKYRKKESMLILVKNNLVPFFIQSIQIRRHSAFVRFTGVSGPLQTEPLLSAEVYLPLSELPPLKGKKQFYFHEVVGYEVVDKTKGAIGQIRLVMDHLHQPVFQIVQGETEILVPAVDQIIEKVDRNEKRIYIQAPEGLLDIYLNSPAPDAGNAEA